MSAMRRKTSSIYSDPARVAAHNRGQRAAAERTRDPNAIRDVQPVADERVGPQPPPRPGATRKSPRARSGVEPGDAAAVAAAHRRRAATHKKDAQALKR